MGATERLINAPAMPLARQLAEEKARADRLESEAAWLAIKAAGMGRWIWQHCEQELPYPYEAVDWRRAARKAVAGDTGVGA
ncbi:MAG: hypothetical protein J5960_02765 [Desulfovibrio sp.]|nr:hypothetical protein [Desulfovibrio sp.]